MVWTRSTSYRPISTILIKRYYTNHMFFNVKASNYRTWECIYMYGASAGWLKNICLRQKFCLKSCQYLRKPEPQWSENLKEVYVRNCYKIHSKIHINFNELMNFVFWWSCIKKGSQSPGLTLFLFIVNLIKLKDARLLLEEFALKPERGNPGRDGLYPCCPSHPTHLAELCNQPTNHICLTRMMKFRVLRTYKY